MALFQSSTYTSLMHDGHAQSQTSVPLASTVPSAQSCTISQIIAFPSSLAALRRGIRWNASCWVANHRLNDFEQSQIARYAFHLQQRTPHIEWCHFASDVDDKVDVLIVFPELRTSFREPAVMERWTDSVVLPAFRQLGIAESTLTTSFKIIRVVAGAEREQTLNTYAPDTAQVEVLSKNGGMNSRDMHDIWTLIQENARKTTFFDGFKNLFLVATWRQPKKSQEPVPMEDAWRLATSSWDDAIDMAFVSLDSVHVNASVTINAQYFGARGPDPLNQQASSTPYKPGPDSIWESSRKRKVENDDDAEKRARSEFGGPRPILPGRAITSPNPPSSISSNGMDAEMTM